MKKIFEIVTNRYVLLIALVLIIFLYFKSCQSSNYDDKLSKQNLKALSDSLVVTKDKLNRITYEKTSLVVSERDLKKYNKHLYDELKSERGKVKVIYDTKIVYVRDTIWLKDTVYNLSQDKWKLAWDYADTSFSIKGSSILQLGIKEERPAILGSVSSIDELKMNFVLTGGIKKEGGYYKAFIKSNDSRVKVVGLESAVMEERKPSRLGLDVQAGYGLNLNTSTSQVTIGPYIGFGIGWRIFSFRK